MNKLFITFFVFPPFAMAETLCNFDYLKKEIKEKRKMGHITTLI